MVRLSDLKEGERFSVKQCLLSNIEKLHLMEMGLVLHNNLQLVKKNVFGFMMVQCSGIKYAISCDIMNQIIVESTIS